MTNGLPYQCFLDLSLAGKLGLIAVDEAHLLANWSSFRKSFLHLQQLPRLFPGIPLMGLTATATLKTKEMLLELLGKECACFQASVDRPNIFLEVHELNLPANDPQHGKNSHARMATVLQKHIGQSKAIVYLDFIGDVNSLAIALREKGTHTAAYHGDKMSPHDKAKVIDNWKAGGVQVVVCTKAFGLGINQPDVEAVVRVGCPQSIEDFVQEFGRAGRDGRPARGILLYCEKDLQHASFWAKEREDSVLTSFQESWRFAYSHLVGKCRWQIILQHFGEDTSDVCGRERCCDVCEGLTTTTDMQPEITSILQAVKEIPGKGEKKLAEWIRGAYRQGIGLSLLDDDHETYGIGSQFPHTVEGWRIIIRQAWLLGLLDRKMFLGGGERMACSMVFNTLYPSMTTEEFLRSPTPVAVPTLVDSSRMSCPPVSGSCNPANKKIRQSKGVQALPIIKKLMSSQANWFPIQSANDYHFPGMFQHPFPQRMGHCHDITSLGHYVASDPDFLFSDIQLGKGKCRGWNDCTMSIGGEEDGSGELLKVGYKIVPCKGVKVCEMYEEGCNYVISTREVRNCPTHPDASLLKTADCPVDFVYIRPAASNDNRRWLTGINRLTDMRAENLHTHPFHASSKIPAKVQSDVREAVATNPQLKTKEVITGKGINYMPGAVSLAATHAGKIKNIVQAAKNETNIPSEACILNFDRKIADKHDATMKAKAGSESAHLDEYRKISRPYCRQYVLSPDLSWVLTMLPLQSQVFNDCDFVEIDATFHAATEMEYLLKVVAFNYTTMHWMVVARVRMTKLGANAYGQAFQAIFSSVQQDHPGFSVGNTLLGVIVDWSDAQVKGLKKAVGKSLTEKVLKGCQVHFMRSVKRVSQKLNKSSPGHQAYTTIGYAIPKCSDREEVQILFDVLCGAKEIEEAIKIIPDQSCLKKYAPGHDPTLWKPAEKWCQWWTREYHLHKLAPLHTGEWRLRMRNAIRCLQQDGNRHLRQDAPYLYKCSGGLQQGVQVWQY